MLDTVKMLLFDAFGRIISLIITVASALTTAVEAVDTPTLLSGLIFIAILGALVLALRIFNRWKRKRFYQVRAMRMNPTQKALLMKQIMGQGIHDAFFDAWCEGQITEEDYQRGCQTAANIYDLGDLLPRQRKLLKRAIKDRIKSSKVSPAPMIPGEPPIKDIKPNNFDNVVAHPTVSEGFMGSFMNRFKKSA